jgi:MtN3 and saliva related transmembrane protein
MPLNPVELIGLAATTLTTPSFVPQAIKILRTRDTKAISLWMYTMLAAGIFLWIVYGIAIGSPGLIIGNIITFVLVAAILALKIRHG